MALGFELVRAPLRLALSAAEGLLDASLALVRGTRELLEPSDEPAPHRAADSVPVPPPAAARRPAPPAAAPSRPSAPAAPPVPAAEEHVDEEVVLAAEVAEAGAEEGAHAEIHIEEPWEGYDRMRVAEITSELDGATREALAAVELYEGAHKGRRTVLEAAERRLRALSGRGALAGNGDAPAS